VIDVVKKTFVKILKVCCVTSRLVVMVMVMVMTKQMK
jgi:hypothetical protein